jgi:hypothetical protein
MGILLLVLYFGTGASLAAPQPFALLHSLFDPSTNAQAGALQGYSVAIDGDVAVVGAIFDSVGDSGSGVTKVYDATSGMLLHTLINPSPAIADNFGGSVAISGRRVVVGAHWDNTGADDAGSAYVYDLAGATPTVPVATLTNPSPAAADLFGFSVATSGNRVVVGTPADHTTIISSGAAYVYDLAGAFPTVPALTLTNPGPSAHDNFGYSVAISGTRVVIGAYRDDAGAEDAGSVYVYDLAGSKPAVPVFMLTNPSPARSSFFGHSIGMSGTRLVVAAPCETWGAGCVGSAYVYDFAGLDPWVPFLTLTNAGPATDFFFSGVLAAISGTKVVLGNPQAGSGTNKAGRAWVFDLAGGTPNLPAVVLTSPGLAEDDRFGSAVAVSDSRVVVGAYGDDSAASFAGSAYVFDVSGATPDLPAATLNRPSPAAGDEFGLGVSVSGTRVAVGAPFDDSGGPATGSVYVYDLASVIPTTPVLTLTNPSPVRHDVRRSVLAISGTWLVLGAYLDNTGATNAGSAYVYDLAGDAAADPALMLTNPNPAFIAYFGYSVAISGSRAVVGAPQDAVGLVRAGNAYVFDLSGPTPTVPLLTLTNPSPTWYDYFGSSVAIAGTRVVVGAGWEDAGEMNAGSAYVYDLAGATPTVPVLTLTNPSPAREDYFGASVAVSGLWVVVAAYGDDTGADSAGIAYIYDLTSATPTMPAVVLTNPSPTFSGDFGSSVAISGTRVVVGARNDRSGAIGAGRAYVYDLASATPAWPVATLNNPSPAGDDNFGWSAAIDGGTIVIGAPFDDANATDRGAAYVFGNLPELRMAPCAPGFATLSWAPATSSGFVLQYADRLAPSNWAGAPSGAMNPVTISTTNAARFYRVSRP